MKDRWLSVDDIIEYLGIKKYTLYKWLREGNVPAHKIGNLWKFKMAEIDKWIKSGEANIKNHK